MKRDKTMRYKLTTQDMKTRVGLPNETAWVLGKWVEAKGKPKHNLCSTSYIHWYTDPLLAVLFNPIHANINDPRIWEIETAGDEQLDGSLKGGSQRVRLMKEIALPTVTMEQRIRFVILCVKEVYAADKWQTWADNWLSGKDRSYASACIAYCTITGAEKAFPVIFSSIPHTTIALSATGLSLNRPAEFAAAYISEIAARAALGNPGADDPNYSVYAAAAAELAASIPHKPGLPALDLPALARQAMAYPQEDIQ